VLFDQGASHARD